MHKKYLIGVDIGGTAVKMGLFSAEGALLQKNSFKTPKNYSETLKNVAETAVDMLKAHAASVDEVIGMGVGVPGPVDESGVVHGCVNLGWGDVPVVKLLENLCPIKAAAQNDANTAALGELWQGAGKDSESFFIFTLGTGVGGAAVLNKQLWHGFHGGGGEIGHLRVDYDETDLCTCGQTGCLEQFSSATGLVRITRRMLKNGAESTLSIYDLDAKRIFDAFLQGDETAKKAVSIMVSRLSQAISELTVILDPETVIIGGGVSQAGEPLIELIRRQYQKAAYKDMKDTKIVLSALGNDAGIYGGAYLALKSFWHAKRQRG